MEYARTLLYIVSAICFVFGLKGLSKATTARRGNGLSALGMLIAIVATLINVVGVQWIIVGAAAGALIGVLAARLVKMTGMPEMVALFNGFGGLASLLVGFGTYQEAADGAGVTFGMVTADSAAFLTQIGGTFSGVTIYLAVLIGGLTFTGSIIAWGKLSGVITTKPVQFPLQQVLNALILLAIVAGCVAFVLYPDYYWIPIVAVGLAFLLGIMAVIPIGGADMPVVISLLNSYSGLAACAAGFVIRNNLLIITGALVGASGIVLTQIMCKAMNRSLTNVLFSGFGAAAGSTSGGSGAEHGEAKSMTPEDAYHILEAARSVVFIPGYGMAVAQAQHAVRELGQLLEHNGAEVRFAIHPVAGRMPGHMNVLLAEANVDYDKLVEMDDVNPSMGTVDVAMVIGANDVVNPAAREDEGSPIYGMPIINADAAATCFILKRSMASGFAGIENPLFFNDNSYMIFGDAKATVEALAGEFKES